MGKKQGRNRNSGLSPYSLSSKETNKTKNTSQYKRETFTEERDLSHSRTNGQLSSNPFQFVKTRAEDSSTSQALRRPDVHTTTSSHTITNSEGQYRYYQTSQNRWMNPNEYKVHNINCWLDNVLKNNQNNLEQNEDFELHESSGTDSDAESVCLEDDSASCSFRTNQRYQPYGASVKRELLIVDQNETSYRQDKIRTLKALIARHDERLNGVNRLQHMETDEQDYNETSYRQDKIKTLKALIAKHDGRYLNEANRSQNLVTKEENQNNLGKRSGPDRAKNCQLHQNVKAKTSCKPMKEKKTSFDIRKPNSIFFAVLNEEHINNEQNTPKSHFTRRRLKAKPNVRTEHSWSFGCGSATLSERKEDFSLSARIEFEHISA